MEILDVPLATAFESRQHPDEQHLRILDVPPDDLPTLAGKQDPGA